MITKAAKREIDMHNFLLDLNKCSGSIFLDTPKGDRFDLHIIFSRYTLAAIIENGKLPAGATYTFEESDLPILAPYLD